MFSAEMRSLEFYPCLLGKTKAADTQRVWNCQHSLCHSVPRESEGSFSAHPLLCCAVNTSIIQTRAQGAELTAYTNLLCPTPLPPENAAVPPLCW